MFGSSEEKEFPAALPALVAYIDGGARGNPGPAGYGVSITDGSGKKVAELSEYLGHQTNNFAEYSGLVAALEYAVAHGHKSLQVVSDSELLVKQMKGIYKVKSESLIDIYQEAKELVRKLDSFSVRHVLRAQNKDADRLANLAMDRGMGRASVEPLPAPKPRASAPEPQDEPRELEGVVKAGVVRFSGEGLPEGTRVKIRPVR
jgi:ribonuclease HI